MSFTFKQATKEQAKARISLIGPSGAGKTYSALKVAQGLGGNIAVIDTENGSASKYADEFNFQVLELDNCAPANYVQAIQAAEEAGFDVLIIDSLSHAWSGRGGALEMVDKAAKRYRDNSYAAWRDVTPEHNKMVDALVRCKSHLIVTMRAKTEYALQKDDKTGKTRPVKIGMAPIQRDGVEYEFDIVADIDLDHNLVVSKTRCRELDGAVIHKPAKGLGDTIRSWLMDGEKPTENTQPDPDPSQWLPSINEFFDQINQDFGYSRQDAGTIIKEQCGISGFKPEKASEIYNCLAKYVAEQKQNQAISRDKELDPAAPPDEADQSPLFPDEPATEANGAYQA